MIHMALMVIAVSPLPEPEPRIKDRKVVNIVRRTFLFCQFAKMNVVLNEQNFTFMRRALQMTAFFDDGESTCRKEPVNSTTCISCFISQVATSVTGWEMIRLLIFLLAAGFGDTRNPSNASLPIWLNAAERFCLIHGTDTCEVSVSDAPRTNDFSPTFNFGSSRPRFREASLREFKSFHRTSV